MGLFDKLFGGEKEVHTPSEEVIDAQQAGGSIKFEEIDSNEKAKELASQGILSPMYLMPLRFNGVEEDTNILYVPPLVVELKERYDDMVEELLENEQINGYRCIPEYKGKSFIPSSLTILATMDGEPRFTETIKIWE